MLLAGEIQSWNNELRLSMPFGFGFGQKKRNNTAILITHSDFEPTEKDRK